MSNLNLGWIAVGGCYNMFGGDDSCSFKYKMVMILFKYFKILRYPRITLQIISFGGVINRVTALLDPGWENKIILGSIWK